LDAPYRAWLRDLTPDSDLTAALARWQSTLAALSRPLADALVAAAPPAAWTGRTIRARLVNVALARIWFDSAVRKSLPLAQHAGPDKTLVEATR
jgi:CRISPR system Cascade subunit CasA